MRMTHEFISDHVNIATKVIRATAEKAHALVVVSFRNKTSADLTWLRFSSYRFEILFRVREAGQLIPVRLGLVLK